MQISLVPSVQPHTLVYNIFKTPIGKIGAAVTPLGVCQVMLSLSKESEFIKTLKTIHPNPQKLPNQLIELEKEFHLYFSNKLKIFSFKPDLLQGTKFQQRVWNKLKSVPFGKTKSYQWLATAIGQPKTTRAVGNANRRNPIPIIIPCHRIIRKNGDLGGFNGRINLKKYLIDLEKKGHASL